MKEKHGAQKFVKSKLPTKVDIVCREELNGAEVKIDLPFTAGVIGDFTGEWDENDSTNSNTECRGQLPDRKFMEVNTSNFNKVMSLIKPGVKINVPNKITGEENISVELKMNSMKDFEPESIATQVPALKKLLELRNSLEYLKNNSQNRKFYKILEEISNNPALADAISQAGNLNKEN